MADRFVRVRLELPEDSKDTKKDKWQPNRKLRYNHKDLRDVQNAASKDFGRPVTIGDLYSDAFTGWPYLLLYGLRWQDLQLSLDKCSELIDGWRDSHPDEKAPLQSLGEKIIEALNASGFVKIEAEGKLDEDGPEGNELKEDA